jgi:hypothetical protein
MKTTIKKVKLADPSVSTDVVHLVDLSDGRRLQLWSGAATYCLYDTHMGPLVEGAVLKASYLDDDGTTSYKFE